MLIGFREDINDHYIGDLFIFKSDFTYQVYWQTINTNFTSYLLTAGDFDGDGLTDILPSVGSCLYGSGSTTDPLTFKPGLSLNLYYDHNFVFADFNGNGRMDALKIGRGTASHKLYINEINDFDEGHIIDQSELPIGNLDEIRIGDFNGDFVSDICVIKEKSLYSIYQGYGEGFVVSLENKEYYAPQGDDTWEQLKYEFFTGDFNGDGRTDILRSFYYHTSDSERIISNNLILITNVSGTDLTRIYFNPFKGNKSQDDFAPSMISDFNSDGVSDIFANKCFECIFTDCSLIERSYSDNYRLLYLDEQFNAIVSVLDGLGRETNIDYEHLTGEYRMSGVEASFPIAHLPGTLPVVKKVNSYDNNWSSSTEYIFEGAMAHVGGKGFLGFLKTTTKQLLNDNLNYLVTRTYNHLNEEFYYLWPEKTVKSVNFLTNQSVLSETFNEYDDKRFWDDTFGKYRKNHFSYLKKTLNKEYETDGSFMRVSRSDLIYDNTWCNLTAAHSMMDGDPTLSLSSAASSFDFREINTNVYETVTPSLEEEWILGRLSTAYVKKIAPGSEDIDRTTVFEYYDNGLLKWEKTQPWGEKEIKKEYFYDSKGNATRSVTTGADIAEREYKTEYYSDYRFVKSSINPIGHSDIKTYDQLTGDVLTKVDPNGLEMTMLYDGFGRLKETTNPDTTKSVALLRWVNTDDADAPWGEGDKPVPLYFSWSRTSGGPPNKTYYDKYGRELRSVTVGLNNQKIFIDTEYNKNSTVDRVSQPYFKGATISEILYTEYDYDKINRVYKVIAPGNRVTETTFNGLSQTITNPGLQDNTKTQNVMGWLVSTTDATNKQNTYTYFSDGNIKSITDPSGNVTSLEYDIFGNRTMLDDPDLGISNTTYYVDGSVKTEDKANGNRVSFTYDLMGRIKTRTEKEGFTEWFYDDKQYGKGKISHVEGPGISENYIYDKLSRLVQKDETFFGSDTFSIFFTFDVIGRLKTMMYPSGYTIMNIYDQNSYLTKIGVSGTGKILWEVNEMNAQGQLKQITLGNSLATYYDYYSESGLIREIETPGIQKMYYEWYDIANLKSRENKLIPGLKEVFYYDDLNRLTDVVKGGMGTLAMTYDILGNITSKSDVGTYHYEGAQPHAVTSISGTNIPISILPQIISYTSFDKVTHIEEGENGSKSVLDINYGISHERKYMVQTTTDAPTKTKYYVGGGLFERVLEGNSVKNIHYLNAGSGLFAIYTEETSKSTTDQKEAKSTKNSYQYLLSDHLGSIQYMTDESGIPVEELSFDAWGKRRDPFTWDDFETPPSPGIDRGFTGHEHLDLFSLVNMNGRIYDPVIGRFLSADPYMQMPEHTQGLNRYSYVFNNPLSYTDPSGFLVNGDFFPMWAAVVVGTIVTVASMGTLAPVGVAIIAGAAAGFAGGVVSAAMNGASFGQAMMAGLQGGMLGAAMGLVSFGVGQIFSGVGSIIAKESAKYIIDVGALMGHVSRAAAHGLLNGGIRLLMGGRFEHGMLSGIFASIAGSGVDMIKNAPVALFGIIGAAVGGTAESLGGGKFANGAITGFFVGMFNHSMHQNKQVEKGIPPPTDNQISERLSRFTEKYRQYMRLQIESSGSLPNAVWPEDFAFGGFIPGTDRFGTRDGTLPYYDIELKINQGEKTLIVEFIYTPTDIPKKNYVSSIYNPGLGSSSQGTQEAFSNRYKVYLNHCSGQRVNTVGIIYFRSKADYDTWLKYVHYD